MSDGMTAAHEAHLTGILSRVSTALDKKYRDGQREHKGKIWEKPGMLEHAIEESLDLLVYLHTAKDQRDATGIPVVATGQTRIQSAVETVCNVGLGYLVNLAGQVLIFPLFGLHTSLSANLGIGLAFTALSVTRSYLVRRWFNA